MFDIKSLFVKNHPLFAEKHPVLTHLIVKTAAFLWMEKRFQEFAGEHSTLKGGALIKRAFDHINFAFVVSAEDIKKMPKTGRLIIVSNHPMGNLEGIGLIQVLTEIRPDIKLLVGKALHDMLGMQDLTIPVDNFSQKLSKDSFLLIRQHLDNEGVIVLFPTRMYSDFKNGETIDHAWKGSFLKFALEKKAPIMPVYIGGRNSRTYYYLIKLYENFLTRQVWMRELIQMKMMRELFSQHTNDRIPMIFGDLINAEDIDRQYPEFYDKINAVRERLYALKKKI